MTASGLRDLLRLEPLPFEHVVEVHVAADVELARPLDLHASVLEQARELAVHDRRADLGLDVVADDRQPGLHEPAVPVVLPGDEHRQAVDEPDPRVERLLDVPLGGLLGADGQVADQHVRVRLLQDPDDVVRLARRLRDLLLQVLAEPVVGHPAVDGDAQVRDVGERHGVVLAGEDRLGEVLADLLRIDVEGRRELDVADVVPAEVDVHQARDVFRRIGVAVVLDSLDERARAVAHPDDRHPDLVVDGPMAVWLAVSCGCVVRAHRHAPLTIGGLITPDPAPGYIRAIPIHPITPSSTRPRPYPRAGRGHARRAARPSPRSARTARRSPGRAAPRRTAPPPLRTRGRSRVSPP